MTERRARALKSTDWVAEHLADAHVRVVDGSFHLPASGRDPREEYRACRIPGAVFFDIDAICDPASPWPHMLPTPERFAAAVTDLGIADDDTVVVYDAPDSAGSPRVWWTFRVFGHEDVAILDGGLGKWLAERRPVVEEEDVPAIPRRRPYRARFDSSMVRTAGDVLENVETARELVVDNRSEMRFAGREPEPRPVQRLGHIPGSINIPFQRFVDARRHGVWQPSERIEAAFADAGVDWSRPLVATCGSGVTACSTAFAAFLIGRDAVAVYDGSWTEWGNRDDTPVQR